MIDDRGLPTRPLKWFNKNATCRHPKCVRPAESLGYCSSCYGKFKRGSLGAPPPARNAEYKCDQDGCTQPVEVKGLCRIHYKRNMYKKNREKQCQDARVRRAKKAAANAVTELVSPS